MADAVRYQDTVRSGENAKYESGYLESISCKDEGEYAEYTELDTLRESSPVSSTDHAVNASKSEEQPVNHTIGNPDRNRIANTIKENEDKRPKQILDASATKKLKVLCIVSLAIIIVITVATVALVYILVNKTVATERKSDELQAEIEQLKLQTLNVSGSSHLLESRLQSVESRTGDIEQLKRMTSNVSSDNKNVKTKLEELESKFEDIEQLKRMTSNVSSDNKNTKTKLEELESKFEDEMLEEVEQVKRMVTSLHNNTQDLESQVQILESKIGAQLCTPPYSFNAELNLCWRLETELANWSKARTQCRSEGGDLIILDTPAKVAFIQNYLAKLSIPNYFVYVGGEDMTEEGKFRWVNGEPVKGIPWYSSQPDNYGGVQHCLAMWQYTTSFTFSDIRCTIPCRFLCQRN